MQQRPYPGQIEQWNRDGTIAEAGENTDAVIEPSRTMIWTWSYTQTTRTCEEPEVVHHLAARLGARSLTQGATSSLFPILRQFILYFYFYFTLFSTPGWRVLFVHLLIYFYLFQNL